MKTMSKLMLVGAVAVSMLFSGSVSAQSDSTDKVQVVTGVDLYSNYVWRGSIQSMGPNLQPSIKMVAGGLTIGVWGSTSVVENFIEADPYVSYSFPFGLSLGVTSYFYPSKGGSFFSDSAHAPEINLGFTKGAFSLSANYILTESSVPASAGGDMYFQAGYTFSKFSAFVGGGNGWHTSDGEFMICNVGIGSSKTIEITDKFSIPVTGQIVINPEKEQMFLVVGLTF